MGQEVERMALGEEEIFPLLMIIDVMETVYAQSIYDRGKWQSIPLEDSHIHLALLAE